MTGQEHALPPRGAKTAGAGPKRSRAWIVFRTFLLILLIGVLAACGYGLYTYFTLNETLDKVAVGSDEDVAPEEKADAKPITVLLLGMDKRGQYGGLNTDVIMTAVFNPKDKSAVLVSVPRDTYLDPTGWRPGKANGFYARAYNDNKDTAQEEVKRIFGEFLGLKIDYVTIINFKTFEDIINELGGIDVYVDQDMRYRDPTDGTDINLREGQQELDGKQALDFVRYRHSNNGETPESSDLERNKRQQLVLQTIVDELKSVNGILAINGILKAVGDNITIDMPKVQLESTIMTYAGIGNDKINYIPLEGVWRSPYIYLEESLLEQAKTALQNQLAK